MICLNASNFLIIYEKTLFGWESSQKPQINGFLKKMLFGF